MKPKHLAHWTMAAVGDIGDIGTLALTASVPITVLL